jgi:hypothetical protein
MNQDGTIEMFHYWNRLRGRRPAPRRTQIEPADIRTLLADTFILEREEDRQTRFRLAGTRLCAAYGRELKGVAFRDLWSERDHAMVSKLVQCVFFDRSVVVVTFIGLTERDRQMEFEMLLLPLEGGGSESRVIGTILPDRRPFWLGADPIVENRLQTLRIVDPDREPLFLANRPALTVPPIVPESSSILGEPVSPRRIRHLLVLDGGRRDND